MTKKPGRGHKPLAYAAAVLEFLVFTASAFTCLTLFRYGVLPLRHRLLILTSLIVLNLIITALVLLGFARKKYAWLGLASALLSLLLAGGVLYYLQTGLATLRELSTGGSGVTTRNYMSLRVLKDSPIQTLDDLNGKRVAAAYSADKANVEQLYAKVSQEHGAVFTVRDALSYPETVRQLYELQAEAIVFNESYLPLILEQHPAFESETRVIAQFELETVSAPETKSRARAASEPFSVYISGIDTSGPIETASRSDVNLIMTVNPQTKTILMVSVPRDSYVSIPGEGGDGYDKLTHAGIYGVETSRETLARLFGVEIDYWLRVNFSSVVQIVDLLGGVEVDNPTAFTGPNAYHFDSGHIYLNGDQALSFARERYSLAGGDLSRGQNQIRLIEGIVRRLSAGEVLANFSSILSVAEKSIQTNMTTREILQLVNVQLERPGEWNFKTMQLSGHGETGLSSYAMPGWELYMYVLDEDSVRAISQAMIDVMGGKNIRGESFVPPADVRASAESAAETADEAEEEGAAGDEAYAAGEPAPELSEVADPAASETAAESETQGTGEAETEGEAPSSEAAETETGTQPEADADAETETD